MTLNNLFLVLVTDVSAPAEFLYTPTPSLAGE